MPDMATEIKAPVFPESVADGTVATWHKKVGEPVSRDDVLVDIETDKVVLEVVAPADGVLISIACPEGETVLSDQVLAQFEAGATAAKITPQTSQSESTQAGPAAIVARPAGHTDATLDTEQSPAVRKAVAENNLDAASIDGTGRGGRVTKEDVQNHLAAPKPAPAAAPTPAQSTALSQAVGERVEKRVPMTRLRQRVAERLLSAAQDTAMLTTFNEVNMKPIMDMRKDYQARFEKRHGVRLGFMSFFVKAATEALKRFPAVNASLQGTDIVYHGYYDIGVAVSSERGLVVPVLRDTDRMNLAEVEKNIIDYGKKARDGKLGIEDMTGGTFTISNGGVFGSLLSTPILNPPQTAILGMHKIQDRPMAVDGQVVILPMMYLALSYDHRLIDGKEAVSFLVTIKELVEDPALLLLDL
jgi:2-oxoglutarate dehydrogenase E2 component (dihydrolipoamide succinyltransferase)